METLCDKQIVVHILLFTYQTIQKTIKHKQLILMKLMIQYVWIFYYSWCALSWIQLSSQKGVIL